MRARSLTFATLAVSLITAAALPAHAKEDTKKPYVGSAAPAMTPEESQKHFKVPDGFEMRLFAAEPDVVNPVAMSFDDQGRLWVVELYEYPYERPKDAGRKGRDRVICLADPDGTGRATQRTVVAEDLWLATAITFGNGGIYVGQAPDLYFYPITEAPDGPKAGERKTVLTGFGLDDKHELLNSFCWGPDGWLYMTHGVFTHSNVRNPRKPNEPSVKVDAGVSRYNPRTDTYELWCDGISNQWGVDWDRAGNAFVSACVVEHIWHVVPGGVYVRQGGVPTIPYTYQLLPPINKDHHRHYMAAYGGINVYQGSLFPEEYRGTAFMGNIHGNCLDHDKLTPDGSSFAASDLRTAKDTGEFLEANDDWFRPVSEQVGPDGALWIMDWYDKYPCYQNSHAPDLDRERGRVWRLVYTGKEPGKAIPTHEKGMDLGAMTDEQLVGLLAHPNVWQRRVAQRLLDERDYGRVTTRSSPPAPLSDLAEHGTTLDARMAAIWTLGSRGWLGEGRVSKAYLAAEFAADKEPAVRAWVARFIGEGVAQPETLEILQKLASDPDPSVLAAVAMAAKRLATKADTTPVITTLVRQKAVAGDPQLPFLIWVATEPKVLQPADPRADAGVGEARLAPDKAGHTGTLLLLSLAKEAGDSPAAADLSRRIIHRLVDAKDPAALAEVVPFLNNLKPEQSAVARGALQGLLDTQQKKGAEAPAGLEKLDLAKLQGSADKAVSAAAAQLAAIWGNAAAAEAGLKVVVDPKASDEDRLKAIRLARQLDSDAARKAVTAILTAPDAREPLKLEAIRTLGEIGDDSSADPILAGWKSYAPDIRRAAAEVLTSRLPWAKALLKAVQAKAVSSDDISQIALRSLSKQKDKEVQSLLTASIGRVRESDPDKQKTIAQKKLVMLAGPVDYEAGHALMQKTCLVCHTFYGEGAHVGPDLTGVGRSSIDALLNNVIDPNQIIGAGYENTIVETKDHRTLNGRLVENTDDHVKLLSAGDKEDVVAKADVASLRTEKISLMPEGLVDAMPDADLRNLLWYVYSPKQDNRDKRLRVDLQDKRLVVSAKLPRSGEMVELLDYVTDPAKRPYLHPLRDPSASIVMTADAPADHPWQHGVFTGLHEVNGLDFWSEKADLQHFVRLLDLTEANDRVGWRSLTDWVSHDGSTVLEEEQAYTVYTVDSPDLYRVDVAWILRAKDKSVKVGRFDYGGFAVRLNTATGHTHLNANGQTNAQTANQDAQWCDVTVPFGDRAAGVTVLDHPTNVGFPSKWRVDGQGLINPSPSLKGDWSIDAGKSRTFHYRLVVHAGPPKAEVLTSEFNQFGAMTFEEASPQSGK